MAVRWSTALFAASGYGLLAVSYRGYGGSTGSPTQTGLSESLGTGVASALAATREAAILVLDSPFSSAVDVAAEHYRVLPVRWLMFDQFRSDLAIRDVHIPVFIAHGDEDRVIPINLATRLFELANQPKMFMKVCGGGHLVLGSAEVFFGHVREWIDARTGVNRHYGDVRE